MSTQFQVVFVVVVNRDSSHPEGTLHGIRLLVKMRFCGADCISKQGLEVGLFPQGFGAHHIGHRLHHGRSYLPAKKMWQLSDVILVVKRFQVFCCETAVIFLLRKLPVGMVLPNSEPSRERCDRVLNVGQIHLQSLQVHVNNGGEFLPENRFGHHGVQYRQGFAAVTVQRVKRYNGVLHGAGQLQPCPIIIELRSNFGRCVANVPSRNMRLVKSAWSRVFWRSCPASNTRSMRHTSCSPLLITLSGIPLGSTVRTGFWRSSSSSSEMGGCWVLSILSGIHLTKKFFCSLQILRGVDANRFNVGDTALMV